MELKVRFIISMLICTAFILFSYQPVIGASNEEAIARTTAITHLQERANVAIPFMDWLAENTNKTATVEAYLRSGGVNGVSWKAYTDYIRDNVPVIVTVGKSVYPDMQATYHSVTGFGFYTAVDGKTVMVVADPQYGLFKELLYTTENQDYIYAIYPVKFK